MSDLTKPTMTAQEARTCIDSINNNLRNTRELLLDLYEREGWRALGYQSWEKCAISEFTEKRRYLFYELAAAKTERNLIDGECTGVHRIGTTPNKQLRPINSLPPEQQREVWEEAVKTAPEGKVTARHVEQVVEGRRPKMKDLMPHEEKLISPEFKAAYDNMMSVLKNEKMLKWACTSKETALRYVRVFEAAINQ